ncbi:MG2 domain-containing protein [Ichthyenterobacterium sp. W332]|uniref:MG2 domain-containing protein n=2 Tax=Microcosmobacter mediterraneus TaxID=3075607 RepID=A0ABU2YK39_9FLAO|nr:MG2 domain-containing protein [Ichthyenterobacterium sp. W332]MDT0558182.1 MG2 domain-containing protein [Ichthyenterobacterium sp. W332]
MHNRKLFVFAILLAFAISCKKQVTETDNIFRFRDYISYTTSGRVSVVEPIKITLANPIESLNLENDLPSDILKIKPHVSGKLVAVNKHSLQFTPDEALDADTEYAVVVNLGKLYDAIPKDYKTYTFQFKTITPNFNIVTNALQSYSKEWQYIDAVMRSADVISLEDAKQLVSASQNGNSLNMVWNEGYERSKYFEFKIDSIKRNTEDSKITVAWNGKKISADNKGSNAITIPGKNNFIITKTEVFQSPEQYLLLNFSDPLQEQQNFDGLVSIQNTQSPQFIVEGNVLKVYPNSKLVGNLQVDVFQGIKNSEGFKLKVPFSELVTFEDIKPQVRLLSSGSILPNSKDLNFNFEAVNLSAVDVRIIKIFEDNVLQFLQNNNLNSNNRRNIRQVGRRIAKQKIELQEPSENTGKWKAYSIDLSKFFTADPGAIYRVELSIKKDYSLYNCDVSANITNSEDNEDYYEDEYYEEDYYDYTEQSTADEDLLEEQYWDNLSYSYRNNRYYNWRYRDNPCHDAFYNDNRTISQNLIASNLGVIAKKGGANDYYFAITNVLNTKPEANAKITLYNYQQQELASAITDNEGLAQLDITKHAAFAIVKKSNQTSYVKLSDGSALSLSKFDVSGQRLQRGLKGYLYGERGVWRPGDSLHLTFILNDNANKLPKNHPVKLEVTDPAGKLVYKKVTPDNTNNFFAFSVPTTPESKTGNYNAKVSVGGATFYKTLKVETVKPNRLKIKIDFEDEILTANKNLEGILDVKWLHGAPAKNIKAEIKAKFSNSYSGFKNYKDYIFRDPTRKFNSEDVTIFENSVNEEGIADVNTALTIGKNAPGLLNVQFLVRAFENGGDFSMDAFTKTYAPYDSFVGLRSPKRRAYGSYFTDEDQEFDIVVVDKNGKPLKREGLEVKIYKVQWRWWWNSSYDDLASYVSNSYHQPFKNFKLDTDSNGKANFTVNVPDAEKGRYLIRVYDPKSGHATGTTAYFYKYWWQNASAQNSENAKMLIFSADKERYNVGDNAVITFPSGHEGRALISIENGSEVLEHRWVKTVKGETKVNIPILPEMAPNIFVNISLLQPHAVTANDLPIRLYGVIPLLVEDPKTKLEPEISMPKTLRPKEDFKVRVSEKNNKSMTYTIAVVEEGLLDLTRFKTPNAWNEFYKREALGVKTWDVFDDIIGAYGGSIDQVFAIGGDGSAASGKKKKANRFKPVVTYLGPFTLNAGEDKSHTIKMPNYIGSVRTMVIAGNTVTDAYGSTEETTPVKKPLMVLATLPRKLSPGEKVTLPVTVFATEKHIKTVDISLKLSDGIKVIGTSTKTLNFAKPDEKMVFFELDVTKAKGINTVEVISKGHGETSSYKVELDVINPNPISSKVIELTLNPNATETFNFETFGVTGTNAATVEFSTMPPMDFSRRLQYLVQYPHGCVEQTTSSVFPQLYLMDIFDLPADKKQDIQSNITNGIKRLGNFQRTNGGMSYWMGEVNVNDWGTSYAGHFMIEAEKKGYVLPLTFKSNWLSYQKEASRKWRPSYRHYNSDLAQAYRLYTLALAGQPDLAAMNRLREFTELSNEAKWRLAAAYALAGQQEASNAISQTANVEFKPPNSNYYTYGSINRNRAMALETMVITKDNRQRELAKVIAKALSDNRWMSTQTTAYSLLAMAKMVEANGGKTLHLEFTNAGQTSAIKTKSAIAQRDLVIKEGTNTITLTNKEANVVYARVLNSGKLPLGKELTEQRGLSVYVEYKDLKGNKIDVTKLQQGQDFVASITIYNLKNSPIKDVALTQIFPSGWEIVNTRFTDFGSTVTSTARYTDIRDDRVNFYFDLYKKSTKQGTKTFNVMLNAAYLGTYYLPGIQAEAMYDNEYLVRGKGQWITIEK